MPEQYTILFVCTGNTCRSPMAEGALRMLIEKQRPGQVCVLSAGTHAATGYPATLYAIEAAKVWNCDLSKHHSQPLTERLIEQADLIFCMTAEHARAVVKMDDRAADKTYLVKNFPDQRLTGEPVDDPIGQSLSEYNRTFLEIGEYLGKHLPEIVQRIDAHWANA